MDRPVYVFGSNLGGRHDLDAAVEAVRHRGAVYGQDTGVQGNSYAIPIMDESLSALSLDQIAEGVDGFLTFARTHPWQLFEVTPIGCGFAGYEPNDIAPMFEGAPHNVTLPRAFSDVLRV